MHQQIIMKRIKHYRFIIAFVTLQFLDVISTRIGVYLGANEINPFFTLLHLNLNVFLVIKLIVVALICYRITSKGISNKFAWVIIGVMILTVLLNSARILSLIFVPELDSFLWAN